MLAEWGTLGVRPLLSDLLRNGALLAVLLRKARFFEGLLGEPDLLVAGGGLVIFADEDGDDFFLGDEGPSWVGARVGRGGDDFELIYLKSLHWTGQGLAYY